MALEDYTAKSYELILYSKIEIDDMNVIEKERVDSSIATKLDLSEKGVTLAGLELAGGFYKLKQTEIPYSSASEAVDVTNSSTVMTPEKVHYVVNLKAVSKDEVGVAYGVAPLGSGGIIDNQYLPATTISKVYVVDTLQDMYDLPTTNTVREGDRAIVIADTVDNNGEYVADQNNPSSSDWIEIPSTAPVSSVNGMVGNVNITSIAESATNKTDIVNLALEVNDNTTAITSLADMSKITVSTEHNADAIFTIGKYKINNSIPTSLPADVSNNLLLNIVGYINNPTYPDKVTQYLIDNSDGKTFERFTNEVSTISWSDWVEVKGFATNTEILKFKEQTLTSTPPAGTLVHESGVLKFFDEFGIPLRIGRMMTTVAYNSTATTIGKGVPVVYTGPYGNDGGCKPAIADTFKNAKLLGFTANEILPGAKGLLITRGLVEDIDTSAYPIGVPMYVSDTVAGDMTADSPDISTQVGVSLLQNATTGKFYVSIINTISLPLTVGSVLGQNNKTYSLTANVPKIITEYTRSLNVVLATDTSAGTITVDRAGIYDLVFEFSGTLTDEEVDMEIELYDVTHDQIIETFIFTSGRAGTYNLVPMTHTFKRPFDVLAANTEYGIRVMSIADEDLVLKDASFTITSINAR